MNTAEHEYTDDNIKSLDWREHIRMRPGMYIGKTGDGSAQDDGIYILFKEIMDNAVDEYVMGAGKKIEVEFDELRVKIRDYGRGIPIGKLIDCVAKINTGGKYDGQAFKKSVGLNGIGAKAVNALSAQFSVQTIRNRKTRSVRFCRGQLEEDRDGETTELNGTIVEFLPDPEIFKDYHFLFEHIENQIRLYSYLNTGLCIHCNERIYQSKQGLLDLVIDRCDEVFAYPPVHLVKEDIEMVLTHGNQYSDQYFSFVNGQHTPQGGTHQAALREGIIKTIREYYKKDFDAADIRMALIGAISIRVEEPIFESQTKTKLGSQWRDPNGQQSIRTWIVDFLKREFDNYLRRSHDTAEALLLRIQVSEKERKEIAGIKKLAGERAKKANIHNKKLRDCKIKLNTKDKRRFETTLFITEGDSASGSITKSRDPLTQAVFSLKGKPLNCYGLSRKIVYQNEEFNLLQHALNIENELDDLRYNKIVLATDADVDGMHIRLLLMTFFLQFYPDLVRAGHLHILKTPLFRVRSKKSTMYCYNEEEKKKAVAMLRPNPEITRFKGLGEISPDEFRRFIGEDIRLDPVSLPTNHSLSFVLGYYMGKNTPERQDFIIDNLKIETNVTIVDEAIPGESAEPNP